jgi:hypothetical protein
VQNFVFFDDGDIDRPIYRVFSIERLLEIFSKKSLVLVKPKKWDDPFENFILKSKIEFANGEQAHIAFANSIFGQCWSHLEESDAMWRIYSPTKSGVKVKTTPRKLRAALAAHVKKPEISAFIGKVRYRPSTELIGMVTDRVRMQNKIFDTSGKGHAETLLFKRDEFSHEQEVRIIYSGNDIEASIDTFSFCIDPHSLLEEIVFDPRMDKNLVSVFTAHFKTISFSGGVKRSQLYDLPDFVVNV